MVDMSLNFSGPELMQVLYPSPSIHQPCGVSPSATQTQGLVHADFHLSTMQGPLGTLNSRAVCRVMETVTQRKAFWLFPGGLQKAVIIVKVGVIRVAGNSLTLLLEEDWLLAWQVPDAIYMSILRSF